jgi:hypothetical protein
MTDAATNEIHTEEGLKHRGCEQSAQVKRITTPLLTPQG